MSRAQSESRRVKRYLSHRAKYGKLRKGDTEKSYMDNMGYEYSYKWIASLSSFWNIFSGCLKNGFPIVVSKLWYSAWAFYPFFFIRKDFKGNPVHTLNHERIHIRQQRDIHLTVSVPLIILCGLAELFGWFNPIYLLCIVPFVPTIVYGFEILHSYLYLWNMNSLRKFDKLDSPITFHKVRENTCFEKEAIAHASNVEYLFERKFWAVIRFM